MSDIATINYVPSATGKAFHECDTFGKHIVGPFGSGKSIICAEDILIYSAAQNVAPNSNIRYSRWGIIRSTYPELISTTRKTLLEVFPSNCGRITEGGTQPIRGLFRIPLWDNTIAHIEFMLQALQSADDAEEKIRSANWTGAWINEATGVAPEVFEKVSGRVGRYPPDYLGGCRWAGMISDFNMPGPRHYLRGFIKNPPEGHTIFMQPQAAFKEEDPSGYVNYTINDAAENLENLGVKQDDDPDNKERGRRYYRNQIEMMKKNGKYNEIDNLFCMMDVPYMEGKPVFPSFKSNIHVASQVLEPENGADVVVGCDTSGIHPSALVYQFFDGVWNILDEMCADDEEGMGLEAFINSVASPLLRNRYKGCEIIIACDPANARDGYTKLSPTAHFRQAGFKTWCPQTNATKIRIAAGEKMLNRLSGGIRISPNCQLLIEALSGGYSYKKHKIHGTVETVYDAKPDKESKYSHIGDAFQYGCMYLVRDSDRKRLDKQMIDRYKESRRILSRTIGGS